MYNNLRCTASCTNLQSNPSSCFHHPTHLDPRYLKLSDEMYMLWRTLESGLSQLFYFMIMFIIIFL
jgi:hypothetical protein